MLVKFSNSNDSQKLIFAKPFNVVYSQKSIFVKYKDLTDYVIRESFCTNLATFRKSFRNNFIIIQDLMEN